MVEEEVLAKVDVWLDVVSLVLWSFNFKFVFKITLNIVYIMQNCVLWKIHKKIKKFEKNDLRKLEHKCTSSMRL